MTESYLIGERLDYERNQLDLLYLQRLFLVGIVGCDELGQNFRQKDATNLNRALCHDCDVKEAYCVA